MSNLFTLLLTSYISKMHRIAQIEVHQSVGYLLAHPYSLGHLSLSCAHHIPDRECIEQAYLVSMQGG